MSGIRAQYDEEFKKNAVKLSCASAKSVKQVAADLGIKENLLYRWRKKCTMTGEKTRYATLEEENKALRLQLAESRIEADMLGEKGYSLLCKPAQVIYGFIYEHQEHSMQKCAVFFQVSRSGYYAFIERRERREQMKTKLFKSRDARRQFVVGEFFRNAEEGMHPFQAIHSAG